MKVIATTCLLLVSISAWCQSGLPAWAFKKFEQFSDKYVLSDYIKPQFLEADLSGDKKPDVAILIERKVDKKKGVLILFSGVDKSFVAGAGEPLGNAGNDFEWAHRWNVFQENTTHQTVFKSNGDVAGAKEVKLDRPAIEITEEEGAGGLIYFNGKQFIWIHQAD